MVEWLITEFTENRDKAMVKKKLYHAPQPGDTKHEGHDCRGPASFFNYLARSGLGLRQKGLV